MKIRQLADDTWWKYVVSLNQKEWPIKLEDLWCSRPIRQWCYEMIAEDNIFFCHYGDIFLRKEEDVTILVLTWNQSDADPI